MGSRLGAGDVVAYAVIPNVVICSCAVYRWVLQFAAPAFDARICQPDRFRGSHTPAAIRCLTKLSTFSRQPQRLHALRREPCGIISQHTILIRVSRTVHLLRYRLMQAVS